MLKFLKYRCSTGKYSKNINIQTSRAYNQYWKFVIDPILYFYKLYRPLNYKLNSGYSIRIVLSSIRPNIRNSKNSEIER